MYEDICDMLLDLACDAEKAGYSAGFSQGIMLVAGAAGQQGTEKEPRNGGDVPSV